MVSTTRLNKVGPIKGHDFGISTGQMLLAAIDDLGFAYHIIVTTDAGELDWLQYEVAHVLSPNRSAPGELSV